MGEGKVALLAFSRYNVEPLSFSAILIALKNDFFDVVYSEREH